MVYIAALEIAACAMVIIAIIIAIVRDRRDKRK